MRRDKISLFSPSRPKNHKIEKTCFKRESKSKCLSDKEKRFFVFLFFFVYFVIILVC